MNLRCIGIILIVVLALPIVASASQTSGTIDATNKYAWSNQAGWVNFGAANGNMLISDAGITGYAWNSNYGWINMAPANGGVSIAANGALSGYAWGTNLGWINFSSASINSSGKFTGQATGTVIGALTFDCTNCNVSTDYRPRSFRVTAQTSSNESPGAISIIASPPTPVATPAESAVANENTAEVGIEPVESTGSVATAPSQILPAQLFDIRLLLDSSSVLRSEDIVSRVTFTSFGRVPTPISLFFSMIDKDGVVVWKGEATTTVQTEAVYTKRLPVLNLVAGNYILKLHTRYNTKVEDDFQQPFQIIKESSLLNWLPWFIGALVLIILLLFIVKFIRDRMRMDADWRGLKTPWQ